MNLGILLSGGKDSLYAAYLAKKQGHELACAITLLPKRADSYMFHTPNLSLVPLVAEAIGLPLISAQTKGEKEKELADLKKAIALAKKKYKIAGVVSGAVRSSYQKQRVDKICAELGISSIAPLWNADEEKYLKELIAARFDVIIAAVAAQGLGEKWLGKKIDAGAVRELKALHERHGISIAGEGGEFETFVQNCPLFRRRIEILRSKTKMENEFTGVLEIGEAKFA
ncbi:MAG: diphthine--ammonia ligase [Candidatus Diapherotrites archaeon]